MNDVLRDLLLNGFMIYPHNGKFVVKKESVPANPTIIKESEYDNYDLAVEAAAQMLHAPCLAHWTVIVRYNRGLGIEYRNLSDVQAVNKEEAQILADDMAKTILGESAIISEVKVRLKNTP